MYTRIESQKMLEDFLNSVNYLHDAILKEFSIGSRGYVDLERNMYGDVAPSDARILFQVQSIQYPCVEIIFETIKEVRIIPGVLISPSGKITNDEKVFYICKAQSKNESKIISKNIKYRILDKKYLGSEFYTIKEIPYGEIKKASMVEVNFIRCVNCSNIFEIKENDVNKCPECKTFLYTGEAYEEKGVKSTLDSCYK